MEAFITSPDALRHADPLTRLLAAILEWLRAMLAAHQAGQLPPTPQRRISARKTAGPSTNPASAAPVVTPPAHTPNRQPRPSRLRALRPRDMSAGLPRPRRVAPS